MATYDQAMEALRKAHAAGNVEDARKIARIADRLKKDGARSDGDLGRGVLRGLQQGLGDVVQLGADMAYSQSKVGPALGPIANMGAEIAERGAEIAGLPKAAEAVGNFRDQMNLRPAPEGLGQAAVEMVGRAPDASTPGGKVAQEATRFATNAAIGPGGVPAVAARLGIGAASGASSEVAGEVFAGTPFEPYARIGGALVGGGVFAGTAAGMRGAYNATTGRGAKAVAGRALQGISDQEFARAQQLQRESLEVGVPLTGPEALDSKTLQALAGDVAVSRTGGPIMQSALTKRQGPDGQVATVVQGQLSDIGSPVTPRETVVSTRRAASNAIGSEKRARTNTVDPFYKAAANEQAPEQLVRPIFDELDAIAKRSPAMRATAERIKADMLNADGQLELNVGALDDSYKKWRDVLTLDPTIDPKALTKSEIGKFKPIIDELGKELERASDNIRQGRAIYEGITKTVIEPMRQAGMDDLARSKGMKAIITAIADPEVASPADIRSTLGRITQEDPNVTRSIVRLYLESRLNQSLQDNMTGPSPAVGAKFRKAVAGTPKSEANFKAMLNAVADANGVPAAQLEAGWKRTLDVLGRTARIPNAGSPTAQRQALSQDLSKGSIGASMADAANITKGSVLNQFASWRRDVLEAKNYERLANIMVAPNSVEQLRLIAKEPAVSLRAQYLVAELLGLRDKNAEGQEQ